MRAIIDPSLILAVLASGRANPAPKRREVAEVGEELDEVDDDAQTDPAPPRSSRTPSM